MKLYNSDRSRWIGGLAVILVIYTLFYLLFADRAFTYDIPRKFRHVIKFGNTIVVYFVSTYHLGKLEDKWMSQVWHFIHVSLLCAITAIGLYDWAFGMVGTKTKELAATMQEFLISQYFMLLWEFSTKGLVASNSSAPLIIEYFGSKLIYTDPENYSSYCSRVDPGI